MAAPKRTQIEREADLLKVADRYLCGIPQHEIAEELGVSRQQIGYDLKVLYSRWQAEQSRKIDEHIARALAEIDHLEREAWAAWDRSCQQSQKTVHVSEDDGKRDLTRETVEVADLYGDPRFLQVIERCIERRCKLLGLDAPEKKDLTSGGKPLDLAGLVTLARGDVSVGISTN